MPPATAVSAPASVETNATVDNAALQSLINMGFPESECRAALIAAMGNPHLASEFLLTGIPSSNLPQVSSVSPARSSPAEVTGIDQLRSHPQFNMLKQLLQQNPAALSQVLDLIGQQNPSLLAAIHANNDAFLAMMNEPIEEPVTSTQPASPIANQGGPADPSQILQFLNSLPVEQRSQFAQSMGMSQEQLQGFMSMMASIPPNELQNFMNSSGREDPPGVVRLSPDEIAVVNRLMDLGFSQQQALQAYIACEKNEALAANLLLEGGLMDDDNDYGDGNDDMYN